MDKEREPQTLTYRYKQHPLVSKAALYAEMNFPCRKYMEDGWIVPNEKEIEIEKEDDALFVVLDGHGGSKVVDHCQQYLHTMFRDIYKPWKSDIPNIFTKVFQKIDDDLLKKDIQDTGSTCCVCFIRKEKEKKVCYLGNMGDTKAVLVSTKEKNQITVVSKTIEHKGTNLREQERVKQAGGTIIQNRVSGSLAVTRALGDLDLKKEGVINIPDVSYFSLEPSDKYIIMATDGLWDIINEEKMKEIIEKDPNLEIDKLAEKLVKYAQDNGTKDNTTILILELRC